MQLTSPRAASAGAARKAAVALIALPAALFGPLAGSAFAQTFTFSTIGQLDGITTGSTPYGSVVVDAAGNVFGTAYNGGSGGLGTVFMIASGTTAVTPLTSFTGAANGANPFGGLAIDAAGNVWGTTYNGGASNLGTVFKVDAATHAVSTVASFNGRTGGNPSGTLLIDGAGNLYGTTFRGGADDSGVVYKIAAGTSTITPVVSFDHLANGLSPSGTLAMDAAGNIYGTTEFNGPDLNGTVFKIPAGTSTIQTIGSFNGGNGSLPSGGVIIDGAGNLYGTAGTGGNFGYGTVFTVPTSTGGIGTVANFAFANGAFPEEGVVMDSDGNLFGTASEGGSGFGTVYEIAAGTGTLTTLVDFDVFTTGATPWSSLFIDGDGNLYGTTQAGINPGDNPGAGTVFKLTRVGTNQQPPDIPEPGAIATGLTMFGATGLGLMRGALARRRRRRCPALA